jgi:hypothetical protein
MKKNILNFLGATCSLAAIIGLCLVTLPKLRAQQTNNSVNRQTNSPALTTASNTNEIIDIFPTMIDRHGSYICTDEGRQNIFIKIRKNTPGFGPTPVFNMLHIPKPTNGDDKITFMGMISNQVVITIGTSNYVVQNGLQ